MRRWARPRRARAVSMPGVPQGASRGLKALPAARALGLTAAGAGTRVAWLPRISITAPADRTGALTLGPGVAAAGLDSMPALRRADPATVQGAVKGGRQALASSPSA